MANYKKKNGHRKQGRFHGFRKRDGSVHMYDVFSKHFVKYLRAALKVEED